MTGKVRRLGGRSARIQAAVHQAVEALSQRIERANLTVPQIATAAGVTPSTIYRRWGGLPELLADVAVRRLRPTTDPVDTGAFRSDLQAWTEQFLEEMSSPVGREMTRDVIADTSDVNAVRCCSYTQDALALIVARARQRGEPCIDVDDLVDQIVAPIMYRILFDDAAPTVGYCRRLIDRALASSSQASSLT